MNPGEARPAQQSAHVQPLIPGLPRALEYAQTRPPRRELHAAAASATAAMCIVGSGVIAVSGALMVGLGSIAAANCVTGRESMRYGSVVLAVAAAVLIVGLARWFRS